MHLDATHLLEVSQNVFTANEAEEDTGGAVLYTCDPTILDFTCTVALLDNDFNENKAARKGGALRYENANFTSVALIFDDETTIAED